MRSIVAILLAATVLIFGSPDASALVDPCDPGELCIYDGVNTTGQSVQTSDRHRVTNKLARDMNNAASSVHNNTLFAAFLYTGRDARGERICILPGDTINDLSTMWFNDVASSSKVKRHVTCPM